MVTLTMDRLRRKLVAERNRLIQELKRVSAWHEEEIQSEMIGELNDYDNHPADLASETFEREKSYTLEENLTDMIRKIDSAIARLDVGTYGICLVCGNHIPTDRLKAIPYAEFCVPCQARVEKQ